MLSKLTLLCVSVVICCSSFHNVYSKPGYFTIVAPGTVRSNSKYQVAISLSDFHQSCWFNVSVYNNKWGHPIIQETVQVQPDTTKLINMQIAGSNNRVGRLEVIGFQGILTRHVALLNIEAHPYTVYIQTDKMKYKPGEVVQFRVICMDRLTRPAKVHEAIVIQIYDGQENLIKELSGIQPVQGVFKDELQLSDYTVLGTWKIVVKSDGLTMREVSFQVARYVLPTFSVEINTRKNIALDDGQIAMIVKASYTYGEPVSGNLSIRLNTSYCAFEDNRPIVLRESQIDGETTITLDFKKDLGINKDIHGHQTLILYKFEVTAVVQDTLTKQYLRAKTEIVLHRHRYKFNIQTPKSFDPDELVNMTASVTDLQNNPIRDVKSPVTISVEGNKLKFENIESSSDDEIFLPWTPFRQSQAMHLNQNGVGFVSFNLSGKDFVNYRVNAEYLGWMSHSTIIETIAANAFNLDLLTERPEVGREFVVELKSIDPIEHFVYEIISRGSIIQSNRIDVPGNMNKYLLRMNATYSMVPKITLFIHRVKNGTFDSRLKEIYIKRAFQNSITITADDEVSPGASVSLNISTDEGSYVGLMGVDQRLLIPGNNTENLTEDNIFTDLRNYDSLDMDTLEYPGITAGLLTFSNAQNRAGITIGTPITTRVSESTYPIAETFDTPSIELPRVRKLFSESWFFKDFERTPIGGLSVRETIPDTITSWAITGFSLNPITGLTLTKDSTKLKVFQPLFVSLDLPSSVKEGEIIEVSVYVFNYLAQDIQAEVTMKKQSPDLELLNSRSSEQGMQTHQTISKSIPSKGKVKLAYFLRPRKQGRYNVIVTAISGKASDAIEKTLFVEYEGISYSISKTYLVHFLQESEQEDEILLDIPKNAIAGSERVQLSVVGDIFGPLIRSLQKMVRVSFGNGEDNIRLFVSNLLVLKYLKASNHLNPSLERKIKLYLELGYQTQMTFKHLDGSFGNFDRRVRRTGDIWLTAYAMWGLQQAKHFIRVDSHVIERGLTYLKSKQAKNGCFDSGQGIEEDAALTALTLLAFLADGESRKEYTEIINNGMKYLYEILDDLEQSPPAVMSTYALVLGKHEKSDELLGKLSSNSGLTSKQIMWAKPDSLQSNLETTADSFLQLLESQKKPVQTVLPIVKNLISSEMCDRAPSYMIALEAMISFAREMDFGRKDLNISFTNDIGGSGGFYVGGNNAPVLQTVQLNGTTRKVRLHTKGNGYAIVNIQYRYNMLTESLASSNYQTNVTLRESGYSIYILEVCLASRLLNERSNLTVLEVNLQSGYRADEKALEETQKINNQVKSIEINSNDGSIQVFFDNIDKRGTCVQLITLKVYSVFDAKPASVIVYDAYKEDQRTVSFYSLDSSTVDRGANR